MKLRHSVPGNYYPIIADRYNQTEQLSLTVQDADLRLSSYIPSHIKIGEWHNIQILDRYQRIVEIRQTEGQEILYASYVRDTQNDEEYIRIRGLKSGSTTLEIEDAEGSIVTLDFIVGEPESESEGDDIIENEIEFQKLIFEEAEGEKGLSSIYFEIRGTPEEVGIQFQDENGITFRQKIEVQDNGEYLVGLDENICFYCSQNFIPYYINGNEVTYYQQEYLAFGPSIASNSEIVINGIITEYVSDKFYDLKQYAKEQLGVLYDRIGEAYTEFEEYKEYLTVYNIQFVEGYVGVSTMSMVVGPGKLKGTKSVDRIVEKVGKVTTIGKKSKLLGLLKPIKSIDSHVFTDHAFGANTTKSKFLQGADIEAVIKEGYGKSNKRIEKAISKDKITNQEFDTIKIEVDMGRKVGTNSNGGGDFRIIRIIVDYDGNIVSGYPVGSYQILQ